MLFLAPPSGGKRFDVKEVASLTKAGINVAQGGGSGD